jgi:hypothetical protein
VHLFILKKTFDFYAIYFEKKITHLHCNIKYIINFFNKVFCNWVFIYTVTSGIKIHRVNIKFVKIKIQPPFHVRSIYIFDEILFRGRYFITILNV